VNERARQFQGGAPRRTGPVMRLVLASASPRRRALLLELGCEFAVVPAEVEEITPAHLSPAETATWNARLKARAVSGLHPEAMVLGVDTLVVLDQRVFGKPGDLGEAFAMLAALNGRAHEVFSGVCLAGAGRECTFVERTRVHFYRRSEAERRAYLERIGPLDKAGAYAAQDDDGGMIARVEGSFTNVIGLPVKRLAQELAKFAGAIAAPAERRR
jgi:septum formation protein